MEHVGRGVCGLRLISNQNAFESVQLKRHGDWETEWHGCIPTRSNTAVLSELEWNPRVGGSLLLELDVSVVHFNSIASPSDVFVGIENLCHRLPRLLELNQLLLLGVRRCISNRPHRPSYCTMRI